MRVIRVRPDLRELVTCGVFVVLAAGEHSHVTVIPRPAHTETQLNVRMGE